MACCPNPGDGQRHSGLLLGAKLRDIIKLVKEESKHSTANLKRLFSSFINI